MSAPWFHPSIDFTSSPNLIAFLEDDAFFRGIQGPRGSGKSTGMCAEIIATALQQPPSAIDNYRYTRHVITRSTSPELKSTTIKTWEALFPPEHTKIETRMSSPIQWTWILPKHKGDPGIHCEVLFIPLDRPKDVKKLLSMEFTTGYANEACETPKAIIDNMSASAGRYPSAPHSGGHQFAFLTADSNPPDDDQNWWNKLVESGGEGAESDPLRWRFWRQPPGVIEVKPLSSGMFETSEKGVPLMQFDRSQVWDAGNAHWAINPGAENLGNLRGTGPGGRGGDLYYRQLLMGKSYAWIQRYAQGKCVFVQDGQPVMPEFHHSMIRSLTVSDDDELFAGFDIGGGTLNPAAVVCKRNARGILCVLAEFVCPEMGVERFCTGFNLWFASKFPGRSLKVAWVDPASIGRDEIFEVVVLDHLRTKGIPAMPAPTNDISRRREALAAPMNRNIDGVPGFLVDPSCKQLIGALSGKWKFRRLQVAGSEAKFADKPEKSHPWSDIGDAASYAASGSGEDQMLRVGQQAGVQPGMGKAPAPFMAQTDFNVF